MSARMRSSSRPGPALPSEAAGTMRLAGVIGWPIAHSRSPRLHGFWLRTYAIAGRYVARAIPPDGFEEGIDGLRAEGFVGWNVTLPHKTAMAARVDRLDPLAARIGAVNTVVVEADGGLLGRNTDAFGFLQNLDTGAPGWQAGDRPVCLLGAGGAARAMIVGLLERGVGGIRLSNRTRERVEALAAEFGAAIEPVPWERRSEALDGCGLLVNSTSLGMQGQPALDLPLDALPSDAVVNDAVYTPLRTDLLVRAEAGGRRTVDGLGMLLYQAVPGFEAWFGRRPDVTPALRAHVLSDEQVS